jgi:hypothetical protein
MKEIKQQQPENNLYKPPLPKTQIQLFENTTDTISKEKESSANNKNRL